jgi:predicted SAM-dependent methyltransferase
MTNALRLHIGGETPKEGWKILNAQSKPGVDFVGPAHDLRQFADGSVAEMYASHVYEHMSYQNELPIALREAHRVLAPGGQLMMSVPDLETLCWLFASPQINPEGKFHIMRIIYGGQIDAYDFHKVGFSAAILTGLLRAAGFTRFERVDNFGLFDDMSTTKVAGIAISLNLRAFK